MPVEAAKQERERKIAQARRRRWLRVLAGLVVLGAFVAAALLVYNSSLFSVRRIEVSGNHQLTQSEIVRSSQLQLGENIFRVDLDAATARLSKDAWLQSASLSRKLPGIIRISVRERSAVASLYRTEAQYLLDSGGFVLARRGPLADTGWPTLRDIDVGKVVVGTRLTSPVLGDALKALLSLSPDLRKTVDIVYAPAADKLVFITDEGLEIDYGKAEDMQAKNEVIHKVLKEESGRIIVIDVRVVTNPATKPVVRKLGGVPAN